MKKWKTYCIVRCSILIWMQLRNCGRCAINLYLFRRKVKILCWIPAVITYSRNFFVTASKPKAFCSPLWPQPSMVDSIQTTVVNVLPATDIEFAVISTQQKSFVCDKLTYSDFPMKGWIPWWLLPANLFMHRFLLHKDCVSVIIRVMQINRRAGWWNTCRSNTGFGWSGIDSVTSILDTSRFCHSTILAIALTLIFLSISYALRVGFSNCEGGGIFCTPQ